MSISTTKPRGVYTKINDDWIPVLHLLNLGEGDTVEIMTMREQAKLTKIGDNWIPVATLVDSTGDAVVFGGGQLPYIILTPNASATGVAWPASNRAMLLRFRVAESIEISHITYWVGTASGNVDAGIYTSTDNGVNLTRMGSSGSTAAAGANALQALALTAVVDLVPGVDYWAALAADNTTLTTLRQAEAVAVTAFGAHLLNAATSFPLPATITTATSGTAYAPWLGLD